METVVISHSIFQIHSGDCNHGPSASGLQATYGAQTMDVFLRCQFRSVCKSRLLASVGVLSPNVLLISVLAAGIISTYVSQPLGTWVFILGLTLSVVSLLALPLLMTLSLRTSHDSGIFEKSYHLNRFEIWKKSVNVDRLLLCRKRRYITSSDGPAMATTQYVLLGYSGDREVTLLSSAEVWLFGIDKSPKEKRNRRVSQNGARGESKSPKNDE